MGATQSRRKEQRQNEQQSQSNDWEEHLKKLEKEKKEHNTKWLKYNEILVEADELVFFGEKVYRQPGQTGIRKGDVIDVMPNRWSWDKVKDIRVEKVACRCNSKYYLYGLQCTRCKQIIQESEKNGLTVAYQAYIVGEYGEERDNYNWYAYYGDYLCDDCMTDLKEKYRTQGTTNDPQMDEIFAFVHKILVRDKARNIICRFILKRLKTNHADGKHTDETE